MLLTPERICAFAWRAQRSLQTADIGLRRVLIGLIQERRSTSLRYYSVEHATPSTSNFEPSPVTGAGNHDHQIASSVTPIPTDSFQHGIKRPLPVSCPGCGALSQETAAEEAGFYSRSRKAVKQFLKQNKELKQHRRENAAVISEADIREAEEEQNASEAWKEGNDYRNSTTSEEILSIPVCDRCHNLIYNARGQSIAHPTLEALADSIAESPFNRNHVYHVLDSADFPMSLVPGIFSRLEVAKPRSQNRRSQHDFSRKPTVSFIITRSDLLGPTKEMVDSMMPYFQSVLRTALGRTGRDMRLGNVHLVSAKRGWWTTDIKDDIWKRGGGNWMLGKVNVGKSNLFEVLFPKGSGERAPVYGDLKQQVEQEQEHESAEEANVVELLSEDSLLPPAQPEMPFPTFPLVSSLPGTTASPIRLPFGGHRGELIDLPGLQRGDLERYVQPDHKLDLVMSFRPNVAQQTIKAGQSLILGGGLVRITPNLDPNDRSTTMLAYPFVPIEAHVTSTDKAIGTQLQERESGIKSILIEGTGEKMSSAGTIRLNTDVTKSRSGPLLRAGVPLSRLPFRVFSTDLLIEGIGWVELVCQVRRQRLPTSSESPASSSISSQSQDSSSSSIPTRPPQPSNLETIATSFSPFSSTIPLISQDTPVQPQDPITTDQAQPFTEFPFPTIEVFTPNGKHIAQRRPLGAWMLWSEGRQRRLKTAAKARPRKPMKGAKKREKSQKMISDTVGT